MQNIAAGLARDGSAHLNHGGGLGMEVAVTCLVQTKTLNEKNDGSNWRALSVSHGNVRLRVNPRHLLLWLRVAKYLIAGV